MFINNKATRVQTPQPASFKCISTKPAHSNGTKTLNTETMSPLPSQPKFCFRCSVVEMEVWLPQTLDQTQALFSQKQYKRTHWDVPSQALELNDVKK
ncbi:hypothetical protein STEG23_016538 [Scotinomys teguina]